MMTLNEYLTPDPSLRDPPPSPEFITRTKPSRASRKIALNSKGSVRGFFVTCEQETWYESELEYKVALALLARPDVRDIVDQPPAITYVDDHGKERQHTFDWLAVTDKKYLISVKPSALVAKSGIERILELAARQVSPKIADYVVLVTEQKLSLIDNHNAELIHLARRGIYPNEDAKVAKIAKRLRGTATIASVVEASGLGGSGFNAVVRAIADGRLVLAAPCTIDYAASVKRGRA